MPREPGDKPKTSAYDRALGLLARREHSRRELKLKLRQKGYEGDEAGEAIDRLGEQHYQDDERFAGSLVRSRASQGYGPMRVRAELKSHGLSDARIRAVLDEAGVDWDANALNVLRRRFGGKSTPDQVNAFAWKSQAGKAAKARQRCKSLRFPTTQFRFLAVGPEQKLPPRRLSARATS